MAYNMSQIEQRSLRIAVFTCDGDLAAMFSELAHDFGYDTTSIDPQNHDAAPEADLLVTVDHPTYDANQNFAMQLLQEGQVRNILMCSTLTSRPGTEFGAQIKPNCYELAMPFTADAYELVLGLFQEKLYPSY